MMRNAPAALLALACLAIAGCASSGAGPGIVDPNADRDYVSGRTIHLKMQVVDYDQELYPGLNAWLWAFCVEPFDANDAVSAAAIEYMDRLPGDGTNQPEAGIREHCGVPGPTIRVQQGDRVIVEFTNQHFHPHTIHWHGQYVPTDMDGAQGVSQKGVEKGESFTYEFIAKRAGSLWYHCHIDAGFHVMQGLYGMFIVEPRSDTHEPKDIDHEEILVLSTARRATVEGVPGTSRHNHPPGCFVSGTPGCQNAPQDLTPDVFLINGHSYPFTEQQRQSMVHIKPDTNVRVRILNAGNTFEEIHLHGHDMKVIAQDGVALAIPYFVDTLPIGPAQRFDVVIHGDNPGVWMLHTHVAQDETNDLQFPGGIHTMLVYEGFEGDVHKFPMELPGGIPYMADVHPPADRTFADSVFVGAAAASPAEVPGLPPPGDAALSGVQETRGFEVEMACAVKSIELVARLDGTQAAMAASQLGLALRDPGSTTPRREAALGFNQADPSQPIQEVRYRFEQNATQDAAGTTFYSLPQGNWSIQVTGSAAQVLVTLSTHIDYYGSWEEQRENHHLHQTPLCGRYGYGHDGRVVGAPPA